MFSDAAWLRVWLAYRKAGRAAAKSRAVEALRLGGCKGGFQPLTPLRAAARVLGGHAVPVFSPSALPIGDPSTKDAFAFSEKYLSFAIEPFIMASGWLLFDRAQPLYMAALGGAAKCRRPRRAAQRRALNL